MTAVQKNLSTPQNSILGFRIYRSISMIMIARGAPVGSGIILGRLRLSGPGRALWLHRRRGKARRVKKMMRKRARWSN